MADTLPCSTNVDSQLFTIYFSPGNGIVDSTSAATYNIMIEALARFPSLGLLPIAATSTGPNGNFTYALSGFSAYMNQYGGGNPWPGNFGGSPGGSIDNAGNITCGGIAPGGPSGGPPTCPPGFVYDPTTETCVYDGLGGPPPPPGGPPGGPPPPPTPPPPPPTPPPPPPGPDQLEECCQSSVAQLHAIATWLEYLAELTARQDNGQCCTEITNAIAAISTAVVNQLTPLNTTLVSLETLLSKLAEPAPNTNPDPVTCAQLTAQFDKLVKAISDGDASIADAIAKAPAPAADPNVKRIADAQNGAPADVVPVEAQLDQLLQLAVNNYGFPADFAQILKA